MLIAASGAAATFLVFLPFFAPVLKKAAHLPYLVLAFPLVVVIVIGLWNSTFRRRLFNPRFAENAAAHPPLLVGGAFGACLVLVALGTSPSVRAYAGMDDRAAMFPLRVSGVAIVLSVVIPSLGALYAFTRRRRDLSALAAPTEQPKTVPTIEELETWLASDEPVKLANADLFGHAAIARRIARRLDADTSGAMSQAVVGTLGSGKTTLRNLVAEELARLGSDVVVVPVELWPYETSRAAVEGVIQTLIDKLAEEVDVTALRGVPARYAGAMSAAGGAASVVAELARSSALPFEVLKRIDAVACAIGRTYVLWIEDLERFSPGSGDSADEKVAPIRAVLYGLDLLASVRVVTATTSLKLRFDIEKVARHVEQLPSLETNAAADLVARVTDRMRTVPDVVGFPLEQAASGLGRVGGVNIEQQSWLLPDIRITSLDHAILVATGTPRSLKQGLRRARETWAALPGELDPEELVIMSCLRESQPDVFAAVVDSRVLLGTRRSSFNEDARKAKRDRELTRIGSLVSDDAVREAVLKLIDFVFCEQDDVRPQGMGRMRHRDYFARFLSVPVLLPDEQDQPVLRALHAGIEPTLDIMQTADAGAILAFAPLILSTRQIEELFMRSIAKAPRTSSPIDAHSRFSTAQRLLRRQLRESENTANIPQLLSRALTCAVDLLRFGIAADIESTFVTTQHGSLLPNDDGKSRMQLVTELRASILSRIDGRSNLLEEAFRGAPSESLHQLRWSPGPRDKLSAIVARTARWWKSLAPLIAAGLATDGSALIPQVAHMVTRRGTRPLPEYDRDEVWSLFGDEADAVEHAFASVQDTQWPDDRWVQAAAAGARAARAAAKEGLPVESATDVSDSDGENESVARESPSDEDDDDGALGPGRAHE